jgi:hypothetical protein
MLLAFIANKIYMAILTDQEKEEVTALTTQHKLDIETRRKFEEDAYVIATLRDIQEGRIKG